VSKTRVWPKEKRHFVSLLPDMDYISRIFKLNPIPNKRGYQIVLSISNGKPSKSAGDTVMLKVLRNGNMHDISVKLASRPNPLTPNWITS
jgi:hypothetical protein